MNDSEPEVWNEAVDKGLASEDAAGANTPGTEIHAAGLDDLSPEAADRIRRYMAESTIRGGASPADVADLYTSHEIVDDTEATAYLDRRFVHGEVLADWRAFQDQLSAALLDGKPGMSADAILELVARYGGQDRPARSIFDDPEDDDLDDDDRTTRMDDRDPSLVDLTDASRHAIERHIISDVLCYGVAPYKVMQLRESLRIIDDERALQYLDLPFELGNRPSDWDGLRDRALMCRSYIEGRGIDPATSYQQLDAAHPTLEAVELLNLIEEYDPRR